MNALTRWFLQAKPWQLFLFFAGTYLVEGLVLRATNGSSALVLGAMSALDMLVVAIWFEAAGSFLNSLLPLSSRFNLMIFRLALSASVIYAFFVPGFVLDTSSSVFSMKAGAHLLEWVCGIYVVNLVAKALELAETGNVTSFFDYIVEFFLILSFPVIGVWFIQPRINRLYARSSNRVTSAGTAAHGGIRVPS